MQQKIEMMLAECRHLIEINQQAAKSLNNMIQADKQKANRAKSGQQKADIKVRIAKNTEEYFRISHKINAWKSLLDKYQQRKLNYEKASK